MSDWSILGLIPQGPITRVAAGGTEAEPLFAIGSLAGLALARNPRSDWRWVPPGLVGPFVHGISVSDDEDPAVLVATGHALMASLDGGETWLTAPIAVVDVAMTRGRRGYALSADGHMYEIAVGATDLVVTSLEPPDSRLDSICADRDGRPLGVAGGRLIRYSKGQWHALGSMTDVVGVSASRSDSVLVGTERHGAFLMRDGRFTRLEIDSQESIVSVAMDAMGERIGVTTPTRALISGDLGTTWDTLDPGGQPTDVAIHGGHAIVGLRDGRCFSLADDGSWVAVDAPPNAAAHDIRDRGGSWRVDTLDGRYLSTDLGRSWARDSGSGLTRGGEATSNPSTNVGDSSGAEPWWPSGTGANTDLEYGSVGPSEELVGMILAELEGRPTLYAMIGSECRILWEGRTGEAARLTTVQGARGTYVVSGNAVYRCSVAGSGVFVREEVQDVPAGATPVAISAVRGRDDDHVLVLWPEGLYISNSNGLTWDACPPPSGAPLTAACLVGRDGVTEIVAVQLGGAVWGKSVSSDPVLGASS